MSQLLEDIIQATQAQNLANSAIHQAYKTTCANSDYSNQLANIMLLDLIKESAELERKLQQIQSVFSDDE